MRCGSRALPAPLTFAASRRSKICSMPGDVSEHVQTAFIQAYAASGRRLGPTWKTLRADKTLTEADLAALNTVLSGRAFERSSSPGQRHFARRLSNKTLARLKDLALLDQSDWEARIRSLEPEATTIPPERPGDTPADRIAHFAQALAPQLAARFGSSSFLGGLSKAKASSFGTSPELVTFLTANPSFDIGLTSVDQFVAANKSTISVAGLADLKTAQRLYRVVPDYASVEAIHTAGYKCGAKHLFQGPRHPFAQMTKCPGWRRRPARCTPRPR